MKKFALFSLLVILTIQNFSLFSQNLKEYNLKTTQSPPKRTLQQPNKPLSDLAWDGHYESVQCVVYNNDGTLFATCGQDGTVRIWNATTGLQVKRFLSTTFMGLQTMIFSPDSKKIYVASGDIQIWDVETGNQLNILRGQPGTVECLAFTPDGNTLVSGSWDKNIWLWDVNSGQSIKTITGIPQDPKSVSVSADGTKLAYTFQEGSNSTTKIVNLSSGSELKTLTGILYSANSSAMSMFSPDGNLLAIPGAAGGDQYIYLYNNADWTLKSSIKISPNISKFTFTGDSKKIIAGCCGNVDIVDLSAGKVTKTFTNNLSCFLSLSCSPDGKSFATANNNGIGLWDVDNGLQVILQGHTWTIAAIAMSPSGRILATAAGSIILWDASNGKLLSTVGKDLGWSDLAIAFSPDGKTLVSGKDDKTIRIWDVSDSINAKLQKTINAHTDRVIGVTISPDGSKIASQSRDQTIKIWNLKTGELIKTISLSASNDSWAAKLKFFPDGSKIAFSDAANVRIFETTNWTEVKQLTGIGKYVNSLAISPNGSKIASVFCDFAGLLKTSMWNINDNWNELWSNSWLPSDIEFSADSKTIAMTGLTTVAGSGVEFHDASTGTYISNIIYEHGYPYHICYNNDGKKLAAGGAGYHNLRVFDLTMDRTPSIVLSISELTFSAINKGDKPQGQKFTIKNGGEGVINWTVSKNALWISINITNNAGYDEVTVSINNTNIPIGTYTAEITVTANGVSNSPQKVKITYTVKDTPPMINVDNTILTFTGAKNVQPANQAFKITNKGGGTMSWSISTNNITYDWLNIIPLFGKDSGNVTVKINPIKDIGTYTATLSILSLDAINSPQTVTVNYIVAQPPIIALTKPSITFSAVQKGSLPANENFTISNSGGGTLNWTLLKDADWLTINPTKGTNTATVAVGVNTTDKSPGNYTATITIQGDGASNTPQSISVAYTVSDQPRISLSRNSISFDAVQNGSPPANESFVLTNGGGGTLNWTVTSNATWLNLNPVSGTIGGTITVIIGTTNLEPKTYNATITVTAASASNSPQTINVTYTVRPSNLALNTTINFPALTSASDYKTTDWKIIGFPGNSGEPVKTFLSLTGDQDKDWQIIWDNGAASNYMVKYDGSSTFNLTTGKSFWLINRGPLTINKTVQPSSYNANQEIELSIQNGWNLITNPFSTSVLWSKVQSTNNITEQINKFSGGFSTSTDFAPYTGYYFYNSSPSRSTLRVPQAGTSSNKLSNEEVADAISWKIDITLNTPDYKSIISIGVSKEAEAGLNKFSFRKPRAISEAPEIYFERPEWDKAYKYFYTDIRPEFSQVESWEFEVHSTKEFINKEKLPLTFSGLDAVPTKYEIYLIDMARSRYFDIRKDPVYGLIPAAEKSSFKLIISSDKTIQEKLNSELLPKEFELGQNYPNPFNPSTSIPVTIASLSETKILVFDLLGREIKVLFNGLLEPGKYIFSWDSKDEKGNIQANGMYIYSMTANRDIKLFGKMILMK